MATCKHPMIFAVSMVIGLVSGCGQSEPAAPLDPVAVPDPVLATWNDQVEIRKSEYESWLHWRQLPDDRSNLVQFATGRVLAQAAMQRKEGGTFPGAHQIEDRVRVVALSDALAEEVVSSVEVTEAEIDEILRGNPDAFVRPRRFALSNIFLSYTGSNQDRGEVLRRMQALRNRALSGESFSVLAERESESQSRFRGGKLGLVKLEELPVDVVRVIETMREGEISPIIDSAGGLAIYLCERIDEPLVHPPEVVRKKVEAVLREQKATKLRNTLNDELLSRSGLASTADPNGRTLEGLRAQEAVARGLQEREDVLEAIRWRTMQQLAIYEMQRRAQERRKEPEIQTLREQFEAMQASGKALVRHRVSGIAFGEATSGSAEQARSVLIELERGVLSFEDAARRFSKHESSLMGGDLGWFDRRQLAMSDWSLMRAVRKMDVGELSGVLTTGTELWIYKVTDRQAGDGVKFEDILPQLKSQYLQKQVRPLQRAVKQEIAQQLIIH